MTNNLQIKDVFFDLDHTLWDFDKNSMLAYKRVFNKFEIDVDFDDFIKIYEPINLAYWKKFREERITKEELRRGRLIDSFKIFNKKYTTLTIDKLADAYIEELPLDNYLFDGALHILDYLAEKYQLHIITNGFEEAQEKKMKASNLRKYFNTVTNSEMVGVKKPNPKIFNFAMDLANAKPEHSVMIGDSLEADIKGAIDVGMQALYFDYKNSDYNDSYQRITHLSALKDLF